MFSLGHDLMAKAEAQDPNHTNTFMASAHVRSTSIPWPKQVIQPNATWMGQRNIFRPKVGEEGSDYLLGNNSNYNI